MMLVSLRQNAIEFQRVALAALMLAMVATIAQHHHQFNAAFACPSLVAFAHALRLLDLPL
jgi:hypothetical protein